MGSKTEQLCAELIQPLARGDVKPGDQLASERQLAQRFAVSRDTVNRALTKLEADGFVERSVGRRARYSNPLMPLFDFSSSEPGAGAQDLLAVFRLRAQLEGAAAYFCALRASDAELREIDAEYDQMRARNLGETTLSKAKADLRFHTLIADCSHHLAVSAFSQIFYARFFNAIYSVLDATLRLHGRYPDGISSQHASIHQHLMRREADKARQCAREHVLFTAERYRQTVDSVAVR